MKMRSLLLAASVMAAIAIGVTPSARADDCIDGQTMTNQIGSYTCIAGGFREGAVMPPTDGNPCMEGDTFTGYLGFIYACVGGQYCVATPGVSGRQCPPGRL